MKDFKKSNMIILFFGQPASGKTTLAEEFVKYAYPPAESKGFFRIDGDRWREVSNNKDYSKEGRIANLTSAFNMAKYIELSGFVPVLSFVTPYESLRQLLGDENKVMQVYLEYDIERGRTAYFAKDFEQPKGEYLLLNTSKLGIVECTKKVIQYYKEKYKQ